VQRGRNLEVEAKSCSVFRPASNTHPSRSASPDPTRNTSVTPHPIAKNATSSTPFHSTLYVLGTRQQNDLPMPFLSTKASLINPSDSETSRNSSVGEFHYNIHRTINSLAYSLSVRSLHSISTCILNCDSPGPKAGCQLVGPINDNKEELHGCYSDFIISGFMQGRFKPPPGSDILSDQGIEEWKMAYPYSCCNTCPGVVSSQAVEESNSTFLSKHFTFFAESIFRHSS